MSEKSVVPATLPQVLFVGGMPRSGSTLFDLMAGQLPGFCDVGELFYLWQAGPLRDELCACGEVFSACPFWCRVGETAFGGWDRVDVPAFLALQQRVDRTGRLPLAVAGRLLPRHAADVETYRDIVLRTYAAIAQVTGAGIVVDSTKRPSTAFLLAADDRLDLRIAQIVRDPRGVVNAWSRRVPLPENTGPRGYLKKRTVRQTVRRWVTVNLMTERLSARGVPVVRVRYEDLVREPRQAMRDVLALMDRPQSEDALRFLTDEGGLTMGSSHAMVGGRVRLRSGTVPLRLDEAWHRELPGWKRQVTALATRPLMRRYGYR